MYNNEFEMEFEQALGQHEYGQQEYGQQEYSQQEYGQQESSFDGGSSRESYEFNQEFLGETNHEYEFNGETFEMSGELPETREMELAHELLSVQNEEELNMFLGKLVKRIGSSPIFRGIGRALKSVAKVALPFAGKAIGGFFGGPLGAMAGGKLGSMASKLFELELEGLSPEDQEFEMARAYVRFANSAVQNAAGLQQRQPGTPPPALVRSALTQAARQHAPGLLRPRNANGTFRSANGNCNCRSANGNGTFRSASGNGQQGQSFYPQRGNGQQGQSSYPQRGNGQQGQSFYPQRGDSGRNAPSGTWTRQGRTLVIQL